MKNGDTALEKAGKCQQQKKNKIKWNKKSNLNETVRGEYKSEETENALKDNIMAWKSRKNVIKIFNDFLKLRLKLNTKRNIKKGIKILCPKQILQRLPITFAKVKVSNTSANLLNEIHKIIYSLY